jgi:hypothetical protein
VKAHYCSLAQQWKKRPPGFVALAYFLPIFNDVFHGPCRVTPKQSITRLSEQWRSERESFMERDLSGVDYVYVWVDGIHTRVRLGAQEKLCSLVMIGAREHGGI